jgi:hypothetical protein
MRFEEPKRLRNRKFVIDYAVTKEYMWEEKSAQKRQFSSRELAEYLVKYYIDLAEQYRQV